MLDWSDIRFRLAALAGLKEYSVYQSHISRLIVDEDVWCPCPKDSVWYNGGEGRKTNALENSGMPEVYCKVCEFCLIAL